MDGRIIYKIPLIFSFIVRYFFYDFLVCDYYVFKCFFFLEFTFFIFHPAAIQWTIDMIGNKYSWHWYLRAREIPRSVSKTANKIFHTCLHLRIKKTGHITDIISAVGPAIFLIINESTCEKSCLQFLILTWSGLGGEGGVSHSLKRLVLWKSIQKI